VDAVTEEAGDVRGEIPDVSSVRTPAPSATAESWATPFSDRWQPRGRSERADFSPSSGYNPMELEA
jgi:hypothetical protein